MICLLSFSRRPSQEFNPQLYDDTMKELNRVAEKYNIEISDYKILSNLILMKSDSTNGPNNEYVIDMINFIKYIIRKRNLKRTGIGNFKQTVARPLAALVKPITSMMSWRK